MSDQEGKLQEEARADAESVAVDPVNQPRILATTLDGLVRSCRAETPALVSIAERLLERWNQNPDVVIEVDAEGLRFDDEELLVAGEDEGRWLLPAFMSGLKSIGLGTGPNEEDLIRLATELGALGPNLSSIRRFRDWLWAEGAEGFDIVLDFGFAEGLDAALMDLDTRRERLMALRAEAAGALSMDSLLVTSKDLDAAAARDEFQVSLDAFQQGLKEKKLVMDGEQATRLREVSDDTLFWGDAQVFLALAYPQLRDQIPPERMARRVMALLEQGAALRFLGFLAELRRRREDYVQELLDVLEKEPLAEMLAQRVTIDEQTLPALVDLISAPPTPMVLDFCRLMVERSMEAEQSLQQLARLIVEAGFDVFFSKLDLAGLSPRAVIVLGKLVLACKGPVALLGDLVGRSTPEAGLRVAASLPGEVLWRMKRPVLNLLMNAHPREAHALLRVLLADHTHEWASHLGELLLQSHGKGLPFPVVRTLCKVVAHKRLTRQFLVPLVRSREAADEVKLAALRYIERDAQALEEVAQGRFGGLFQSREVRERIKQARRRHEEKE